MLEETPFGTHILAAYRLLDKTQWKNMLYDPSEDVKLKIDQADAAMKLPDTVENIKRIKELIIAAKNEAVAYATLRRQNAPASPEAAAATAALLQRLSHESMANHKNGETIRVPKPTKSVGSWIDGQWVYTGPPREGFKHGGNDDFDRSNKAPGKNTRKIITEKDEALSALKTEKLSSRQKLVKAVRIHMQSLKTVLEMQKKDWDWYIDLQNNNGTHIRKLLSSHYQTVITTFLKESQEEILEKRQTSSFPGDHILITVESLLASPDVTDPEAIQAKKSLIDWNVKVAECSVGTPRYVGIYREVEECITSLCELTSTKRNETKQTGTVVGDWKPVPPRKVSTPAAQLRLMRACLDARETLF